MWNFEECKENRIYRWKNAVAMVQNDRRTIQKLGKMLQSCPKTIVKRLDSRLRNSKGIKNSYIKVKKILENRTIDDLIKKFTIIQEKVYFLEKIRRF
ncbi:hypothetical protein [Candidatus Riesia pediculischaeffi]|uniref:Uncharacterized protein n=2 Tax=Candidatus Riesia pediculischaeffi TaxID=428411 RepID=A0A1V0HKX4_9ENTR|nr:hypothetical protein [Candidatus Riesia pediculischaeffi]ARC53475.1 hypothetical protein AOQ87_02375 [Candidatus Riesia pediculischaeffi]KIE64029.1 hypothetical protein P689_122198 [Candidatus Riesia pediculischaeffi PTSU]